MRTVNQVRSDIERLYAEAICLNVQEPELREKRMELFHLLNEFEFVKVEYIRDDIMSLLQDVK